MSPARSRLGALLPQVAKLRTRLPRRFRRRRSGWVCQPGFENRKSELGTGFCAYIAEDVGNQILQRNAPAEDFGALQSPVRQE